ncbi:hypothetical protein EFP95_03625 [Lentilactobacillus hilgardii]|nr:hypothetical protein [Lentilactobacillus hilgardii]
MELYIIKFIKVMSMRYKIMEKNMNTEKVVLDQLVELHMNGYDSYDCAGCILPMLIAKGYNKADVFSALRELSADNMINIKAFSQNPNSDFKCVSLIPFTDKGFAYWKKYC